MSDDIEIRLSGSGGQGLILAASILSAAFIAQGRSVAQSQAYEPTSRGGLSRSDLVVSEGQADYPLAHELNYVVILHQVAVAASDGMISDSAVVITDSKLVTEPPAGKFQLLELPITETAIKLGNRRIANTIALAALACLGKFGDHDELEKIVTSRSPKAYTELNRDAFNKGWEMSVNS